MKLTSPILMVGLVAVAGVGGYMLLMRPATPAPDAAASNPTPLLYATGNGTQATSSNQVSSGQSDNNTALAAIAAANSHISDNTASVALAQIKASKDAAGQSLIAGFVGNIFKNFAGMAKAGVSQLGGTGTIGDQTFSLNTGLVYTNPALNMSYAAGYDANHNLIGTGPGGQTMILAPSAQQTYNTTKFTDAKGAVNTGPVVPLGSAWPMGTTATPTPTHVAQPRVTTPVLKNDFSKSSIQDTRPNGQTKNNGRWT